MVFVTDNPKKIERDDSFYADLKNRKRDVVSPSVSRPTTPLQSGLTTPVRPTFSNGPFGWPSPGDNFYGSPYSYARTPVNLSHQNSHLPLLNHNGQFFPQNLSPPFAPHYYHPSVPRQDFSEPSNNSLSNSRENQPGRPIESSRAHLCSRESSPSSRNCSPRFGKRSRFQGDNQKEKERKKKNKQPPKSKAFDSSDEERELQKEMERDFTGSEIDEDDDIDSELVEEARHVAEVANRRNAKRKNRTLNTPEKTVDPMTASGS